MQQIYLIAGGFTFETINQLTYTPKSERDYGTLACWGKNKIGKQVEPCLFQIVPAGEFITYAAWLSIAANF